jgi:hypothetical protein
MNWKILIVFAVVSGLFTMTVVPVSAQGSVYPKLRVEYTGRNLSTGSDWATDLSAGPGDILQLKAVASNSAPGSTIVDTYINVPISPWEGLIKHPTFSLGAMNAGIKDSDVAINTGNKYLKIEYLPGFATITVGGNTTAISPDTEITNLTNQNIKIPDIPYGDGNTVTISYEVLMVDVSSGVAASTPTPTAGGIGGGEVSATSSAVANTNPQTGIGDEVWVLTLSWVTVGAAGFGLKKWASKIRDLVLV